LASFRKRKALGEKSSIVSKQTREEGKGVHNLDFLAKIYFCLKSSILSENRHSKKDGFGLRVSGGKFSSLPKSGKIVMKNLLRV
jgi:hypothetical protein